jgi:hypothetical protein
MQTAFEILSQTTGVERWMCSCGRLNMSRLQPGAFVVTCSNLNCQRKIALGRVYYSVQPNGVKRRPPADLRPIRDSEIAGLQVVDAEQLSPPLPFPPALYGGKWRSGDPASITWPSEPVDDVQYWRVRASGEVLMCKLVALGTRLLTVQLDRGSGLPHEGVRVIALGDMARCADRVELPAAEEPIGPPEP